MKKFFLFTQRGLTDRFFCGNIYEKMPSDEVRYNGCLMPFSDCEEEGLCKSFETLKDANKFSRNEEIAMQESDEYAQEAMDAEERFGCEGVDY